MHWEDEISWKEEYRAKEKLAILQHENKMRRNTKLIIKILSDDANFIKNYPLLAKRCTRIARYLDDFLRYSRNKIIGLNAHNGQGFMFFGSVRHLSRTFGYGDKSTWSRNINLLAALGFVIKIPVEELPSKMRGKAGFHKEFLKHSMRLSKQEIREINFYAIPVYEKTMLNQAEEIAKKMKETGFRLNSINRNYFQINFGEDFAKKVFPNEHRQASEYSEYVAGKIENFILSEIEKNGYVAASGIFTKVKVNVPKGGSSKEMVTREFNRRKRDLFDTYGLVLTKANKELVEAYNLPGYIQVIYKE